ncbi:MAG TPA: carboxypeptidase regulatory-like domain-containing protein [Terriglobales bacterium]|nr:carboxypeptidase regulatory-like domain-containing protein [Terriglobales bacterium]
MWQRFRFQLILFTALYVLATWPCSAQELGTSVLNGAVVDSQGAVVKAAKVTARRASTTVERNTVTSNAGLFVLNSLSPGEYLVRVEAEGFSPVERTVRLEVGQQADLKFQLTVAGGTTTIQIADDEAPLVNTVSSVVDGVVNGHQIDNLPLNGRNFLELSLLMPGNTVAPTFDPTKDRTVVISSAGQLGRGGNVSVDGMDDNDDVVGGMLLNVPEDSVQEFQIATNRFSAELGRSGSSVVNVVTKSGTNALHGSASIYERDKSLQAAIPTFSATPAPGQTPPFSRQQYAGTLGGPLVKDRAWWFGAFEYRDELGGVLVSTRQPIVGGGGTFSNSFASEPATDPLGTARVDWQASTRDVLSFHYGIERQNATGAASFLTGTPIGSASQRQDLRNNFQTFQTSWTRVLSPTLLNRASFSFNNFINITDPVTPGPELDFPSVADGASYRVPQQTRQKRWQWDDGIDWTHGKHNLRFGGQFQRIGADFNLGVFQSGAIEFVQDFANFDHNGDGVINDQDLLFAVTIRSAIPQTPLIIPNADNNFIAGYVQDDWHLHPQFTLNLGLRYELDTDVNNVGHYGQINPILSPFLHGTRHKDINNWGPRVGFNWANKSGQFSLHGGYGIYYDRVTLEIQSLERGLDGRALPIDVRLGNVAYLDNTGHFVPGAPTLADPFTGMIIPGAGGAAEGINIIDNGIQNPMVQQFDAGIQVGVGKNWVVRADGIHNLGTHFIIGVPVGSVFNPVSGGPETVTSLRSAVNTHYDALWLTVDRRFAQRYQMHAAYTLSKALDYANYDQIPFGYPPVDPNDLHREYGPAPNDQLHRLVLQGVVDLPFGFRFSPIWTYGSGVPMDILYIDPNSGNKLRVPQFSRNAGGRVFHNAAELNAALTNINNSGGLGGAPLPLVPSNARFNDSFNSFDMRLSKSFRLTERFTLEAIGEAFNLFNKENVLGVDNSNYSGFFNVLGPSFGKPVSTAGGVFGSGGPRAFQLGGKLTF